MIFSVVRSNSILKHCTRLLSGRLFHNLVKKPPWSVLFFGTDEFSLFSLQALVKEYRKGGLINKLEVVTTIKGKPNPVKTFSEVEDLHFYEWKKSLELNKNAFDVGLVVSFGHLIPESIINKFQFGMLNVHASLLPQWRGAAPIIYSIANGDTITGVTIMKISPKKFDIGEIISQASLPIPPDIKMPQLYSQLGQLGATELITILQDLPLKLSEAKVQPIDGITYAPKVDSTFAIIDWAKMSSVQIFNLERALYTLFHLQTTWKGVSVKLINIHSSSFKFNNICSCNKPGFVEYDKRKRILRILCSDYKFIEVVNIGVVGKKIMDAQDFNNGFLKKEKIESRYFK